MIYYPRMAARLYVPLWGSKPERVMQNATDSVVVLDPLVISARLEKNNFQQADELSLTLDWRDAGVDPRLLDSGTVEFFMADTDGSENWEYGGSKRKDRRFKGVVTEVERSIGDSERVVTIKALDYTALLIESKPYPPQGVPKYSMALDEIWRLICNHAGGKDAEGRWFQSCKYLADKLVPVGFTSWPKLSEAVSGRLSNGHVEVKQKSDAWAVWQYCVGLLGLISWIDQDEVKVSTATNYYTRNAAPVFTVGENVSSIRERRNCAFAGKAVAVLSYDPMTGKRLVATYPTKEKAVKKRSRAITGEKIDSGMASEFDVFDYAGVTNQSVLEDIAKQVFAVRSRTELTGSLITSEMVLPLSTSEPKMFNILDLAAGDDIIVNIDKAVLDGISEFSDDMSIGDRIAWLEQRGYSKDACSLLARNQQAIARLSNQYNVNRVVTSLSSEKDGGSFEVEVEYCNKLPLDPAQLR